MSYETAARESNYSAWAVGWAGFAGFMTILIGVFDVIQGLVALIDDGFYVVGQEWVFEFDVTAWGWIHLILGAVLIASDVGIFSGNVAAGTSVWSSPGLPRSWTSRGSRTIPIWSIIMIAISVAIIWALTAHGRDITM